MKITNLGPSFGRVIAKITQGLWNKISQTWNATAVTWDRW